MQAVITADIVNSTKLTAVQEKRLTKALQKVLATYQYEFYRGDSFQVFFKDASEALQTALMCRTVAISLSQDEETVTSDVRLSIGIGGVKQPVKQLSTARGDAFILSGRAFDKIASTEQRIIIGTGNVLANEGLQVIGDYVNAIFKVMTGKQAAVIFELLKGQTQQVVAEKLSRSKSTIHQHVSSGRWPEIEKLLQQYKNIINQLS